MELSQFLARTVCPGGYIAIAYNKAPGAARDAFSSRLFADGDVVGAAGYAQWCARKGWDVYHAQGSYTAATPRIDSRGQTVYDGSREQINVRALRSFWIDLDCKREGDGKKAESVYADRRAAMAWLKSFCAATGLPLPNQLVNSGYGFHAYWLLEDVLLKHQWQPYADAMKAAMLKHGYTGDHGLTGDSARLLRPAGTFNMKSGQPAAVQIIPQLTRGQYPNQLILDKLAPYVGAVQAATGTGGTGGTMGTVLSMGAPAAAFQGQALPNLNAAAAAGIVRDTRPRYFQRIATECSQAAQSIAAHGSGDPYPLWYLGFLGLLTFTTDGDSYVHPISDGDARYVAANVDTHWQRAKQEQVAKGLGPPTCAMFDRGRAGVCGTCPHFGKITTPLSLGIKDGDLPAGYRREQGVIEARTFDREAKEWTWKLLIEGDIHSPTLDDTGGIYRLQFVYERAGRTRTMATTSLDLVEDIGKLAAQVNKSSMTITRPQTAALGTFLMAWINKLRDLRAERTENVHPFGWATQDDSIIGFAYASKLYRTNGTVEPVPGCEQAIQKLYEPQGKLSEWQRAATFVTNNRVDLQAVVAASFGAPLMLFTGQKGAVISIWSQGSSRGKSSALEVARSIWGGFGTKNTLRDTPMSVMRRVAETRVMPCFWDEMRVGENETSDVVNMVFNIAEGKERGRLYSDASMRPAAEWDTITVCASNASLLDMIASATKGTDAGVLRAFEFEITAPEAPQDPRASKIVALTKNHYGRAGEIYAAYIAQNAQQVEAWVDNVAVKLSADLQATAPERYYVAAVSAMLVGAAIATKLGIMQFDIAGLKAFLYHTYRELRTFRQTAMLVGANGTDYAQIFALFMADHLHSRLVTDRFVRQGGSAAILWQSANMRKVDVHISYQDDAIRVSRIVFGDWCRKKNFQAKSILDLMNKHWGAQVTRATLGGGTSYAVGATFIIEVPLTPQGAQAYRWIDPNAKPGKAVP